MAEQARNPESSDLVDEVDAALRTLDGALTQASRSVVVIRSNVARLAALTELVRDMESAMSRAREGLTKTSASHDPEPILRPVPPPAAEVKPENTYRPPAAATTPGPASSPATPAWPDKPSAPSVDWSKPDEPTTDTPAEDGQVSHCLKLDVTGKSGSLDLKAVDSSVNDNFGVVDVALLDYDGRHATLKLWVNAADDPKKVREALLESLRNRLGGDKNAEITIEFEQQ